MSTDVSKVIVASGTRTLAAQGAPAAEIADARSVGQVDFFLDVTAHAGTTPTLNVDIECWDPGKQGWAVLDSFVEVLEVDSTTILTLTSLPATRIRANWVIVGTGASYTFSVGMVAKDR